ncbi:MAG: hypothetical protein C0616_09915 [Desulfuromonas sp.]|nr:MAG: hypothetical protein C0616_09915 [Desulfuromonas sp.]
MLRRFAFLLLLVPLFAGCSADSPSHPNDFIPVIGLSLSSADNEIAIQTSTRLTAIGELENGQSREVTEDVVWTSSDTNIAFFDTAEGAENRLVGVSAGTVSVTATLEDLTAQIDVVVGDLSVVGVTIYPRNPEDTNASAAAYLPVDETQQFSAIAEMSDGSEQDLTDDVTWFVTDSSTEKVIATISNSIGTKGILTAEEVGEAKINAIYQSIAIDPVDIEVVTGELKTIRIVRRDQADTDDVDGSTTTVLSTLYFKTLASFSVDDQDPTDYPITQQTVWTSSNPDIASISTRANDIGLMEVQALKSGKTTLTARAFGLTQNFVLTVEEIEEILPIGLTIEPADISIARFTRGEVRAILEYDNGATRDISIFETGLLSVENLDIATVETDEGVALIRARAAGQTKLFATYEHPVAGTLIAEADLEVTNAALTGMVLGPNSSRVHVGTTIRLTATGFFSDGSQQEITYDVVWDEFEGDGLSANQNFKGWFEGVDDNLEDEETVSTVIASTTDGIYSATLDVTVDKSLLDSLSITPPNPNLPVGSDQQFSAIGRFGSRTQNISLDVDWSLVPGDDVNIDDADIENSGPAKGLAYGVRVGSFLIEANTESNNNLTDLAAFTTLNLE